MASKVTLYPVVDGSNNPREFNGNFGGRTGADALCAASPNRPTVPTDPFPFVYRAVMSTRADDELRDFPTK